MLVKVKFLREAISNCIVESNLRSLIGHLLQETVIDDVKAKSNRHPEEWDEVFEKLQVLPQAKLKQYLTWLERVSRSNQEPLRDYVLNERKRPLEILYLFSLYIQFGHEM